MFKRMNVIVNLVSFVGFLTLGVGLFAQTPNTTNGTPAESFSGEQFCFDISLDNTGSPGYGPYHRLILPPDLSFDSATFLESGMIVTNVGTFPAAPGNQLTDPRTGTSVSGPEGGTLHLLILPMGSIVTGGPTLTVHVCLTIDVNAVIGTPLDVTVQTVYEFGSTAVGNTPIIGAEVTSAVTPILVLFTKTADPHEAETAPGPDFSYSYTLNVDVANGKTIDNIVINDVLDAAVQFVSLDSITGGSGCGATSTPSTSSPGGTLTIDCTSVIGTTSPNDMVITYTVYVTDILNESNCDNQTITNTATFDADYLTTALPQDTQQETITAKHLPIQKGAAPGSGVPGDTITFSLDFQVTDYGTADGLIITDTLPDGYTFVAHQSFNLGVISPSVSEDVNGVTTIIYDVHAITGDLAPGTTGTITYTATIDQNYTNPAGIVLAADTLVNSVIDDYSLTAGATLCSDDSSATVAILPVSLSKEIVNPKSEYQPGETVTYRLSMTVPSGDSEAIVFEDFFPLPVFDVTTLDLTYGNDIRVDTSDTLGLTPVSITVNGPQNSLRILWPDIHTTSTQTLAILIDITVENDPFNDNLFLTNLFQASSENTPGAQSVGIDPVQIQVRAPVLGILKGIQASDNATAHGTITPVTTPVDGNISASDAGDTLTYVLTVSNTGGAPAFDVIISDPSLPQLTGCTISSVLNGKGRAIAYRDTADVAPPSPPGLPIPTDLSSGILLDENIPHSRDFFIEGTMSAIITTDGGTVGTPDPNDIITYTIEILNNDGPVTSAIFQVTVPPGMTYITNSLTSTLGTTDQGTLPGLNVDLGAMTPAQTATVRFSARIDGGTAPGTAIDVQGTLNSTETTAEMTDFDNDDSNFDQANSLIVGSVLPAQPGPPLLMDNVVIVTYLCTLESSGPNTVQPEEVVTNTGSTTWASGHGETPFPAETDDAIVTMATPGIDKTLTAISPGYSGNLTDAHIGEILTYQVVVTVPEGVSNGVRFVDLLDNGLAFIDALSVTPSSGDITTSIAGGYPGVLAAATITSSGTETYQLDRRLSMDFGTITNANSDDLTPETITIVYRAIVLNWSGNDRGDNRNNRADWFWDNPAGGSDLSVRDRAPNITITEPSLEITKTVVAATGDAGDTLTITLNINHAAASDADAFDVVLEDMLPVGFTFASGFTTSGIVASTGPAHVAGTISASWDTFPLGSVASIQFTVTIDDTVSPTDVITNLGSVEWESLRDADQGGLPSPPLNTLGVERTGNPSDPGGASNDYTASDSDTFTINSAGINKTIDSVSPNGAPGFMTTGDIVTYQFLITLPEGTTTDLELNDTLPPGLQFQVGTVAQNTAGFNGILQPVSTVNTGGNINTTGETVQIIMAGDTTVVSDNVSGNNSFIITIQALVMDLGANGAPMFPGTQNKRNTVSLTFSGYGGPALLDIVDMGFAEPILTMTKEMTPASGLDAGSTVTITLTVNNTGTAPAHDVIVTDIINDNGHILFDLTPVTSVAEGSTPGTFVYSYDPDPDANPATLEGLVTYDISGGTLAANSSAVFTFTAVVRDDVVTGTTYRNDASVNGDSQTGPVAQERSTSDSGFDTVIVDQAAVGKSLTATSENSTDLGDANLGANPPVAIGEVLDYSLTFTLPEGVTRNVTLVDLIPSGLTLISSTATLERNDTDLTTATDPGTINGAAVNTPVSVTLDEATPGQISLALGDVTNIDAVDGSPETLTLKVQMVTANIVANTAGTQESNTGRVTFDDAGGTNIGVNTNPIAVHIAEPTLSVSKSAAPLTVDGGDTVTFTVVVNNTATGTNASTAFDGTFSDSLPVRYKLAPAPAIVSVNTTNTAMVDADITRSFTGRTLNGTYTALAPGESFEIVYTAVVDEATLFGEDIVNTFNADGTSLPGLQGTANATPGNPGDADGERIGTDAVNMAADDNATVTVDQPSLAKTTLNAQARYAIGESVDFQVTVSVPLGTTNTFILTDTLDAGLDYDINSLGIVIPGTVTVSNTPLTEANAAFFTQTGDLLEFDFGTISATVAGNIVLTYSATVENVIGNQNGTVLDNSVSLEIDDPSSPGSTMSVGPVSTDTPALVGEPNLTMGKAITAGGVNADAGNTVGWQVTLQNVGTTTAFQVDWSDVLPDGLFQVAAPSLSISGGDIFLNGTATPVANGDFAISTTTNTNDTITLPAIQIEAGAMLTITFNTTVMDSVTPGQAINNVTQADYTSLEGGGRDNTTDPGNVDDDDDSDLNNYEESASQVLTIGSAITIDKTVNTTTFAIGEEPVYTIRVDLIEGVTPSVVVTDILPAGLTYVSHIISAGNMGMSFSNAFYNTRLGAGQTVQFSFGDVANPTNAINTDDFLTIAITARVDNIVANQGGVVLRNGEQADGSEVYVEYGAAPVRVDFDHDGGTAGIQGIPITIVEPVLNLLKTVSPSDQALGDVVTYTVTITHDGTSTSDAFDLVLDDVLPAGLTYVPGSASLPAVDVTVAGQNLQFRISALTLLTNNTSFTYQATIDLDAAVGSTHTNNLDLVWSSTVGATGAADDGRNGDDGMGGALNDYAANDTADVIPGTPAVIDAQKTVTFATGGDLGTAGQVDPGDTLEYTVTLTNGPNPVTNAVFTDPIPTNTTFVGGSLTSSVGGEDESGDPLLLVTVGNMASGAVVTITFQVTVDASTPEGTVLSNQGSVDSDQTVPEPTDEDGLDENGDQPTDVIVGGPPALENALYVQKLVDWINDTDLNGFVSPTDTLRYFLIIENRGDAALTNVSVTDTIPNGLTYVGGSATIPAGNTITVVGQAVTITIPTLAPHLRETFVASFDVTIDNPLVNFSAPATDETFTNQADTNSDQTDPGQSDSNGNPEDGDQPTKITAYDGAVPSPEIDVEKRWSLLNDVDGDGLVDPGDSIFYLLTVQNVGGVDATNVRLSDSVPANTTMIAGTVVTDQGVVVSEIPIDINIGTISPGGLVTISFQVTVNGGTLDGTIIPNQATVSGDNFPDEPSDDNGDDSDGKNPTLTPVDTGGGSGSGSPSGLSKTLFATSELGSSGSDVFIGEVLTYRVSFDVPAGTLHEVTLSDTLPTGLAYLAGTARLSRTFETGLVSSENPGGINATATGVFTALTDGTDLVATGPVLSLFLGDTINSDNDLNTETYTLEIQVLVENIGANNAGGTLTNTAGLSFMNGLGAMQSLIPVTHDTTIIEPSMFVTKSSDPTMVTTSGGDVTFTVTVTNPSGAFTATGYNVQIIDILDANWVSLSVDSLTPSAGVAGVVDNSIGTTLTVDVATFPEDGQLVLVYVATSDNPLVPGTMTNTATATWTSLPGDHGTGNATAGNPGDADGERTGPVNGTPNDYTAQDTADVNVGDPSIAKVITSLPGRYAIGNVVSYQVSVSMPPNSTLDNSLIEDVLDEGLTYVTGSLAIAWNGLTTTTLPVPTEFTRTDNSPVAGSETLALDLGTFANSTGGILTIVLDYEAIVDDILVNQNNANLNNLATFSYDDPGGSSTIEHSASTQITVGEPHLTLSKTVTSSMVNLDAGDTVNFQVVAGNNGTTTAFETVLADTLPAGLENVTGVAVLAAGGAETPTVTNNGTDWVTSEFDIPVGGTVTITFTATLSATVEPGQTIQNSVSGTFTSVDGPDSDERDGSDPGSQQDDANLDNYNETDSAPVITVNDPIAIDKSFTPIPTNDTYTIGETFTYRLAISVIEGVTQDLVVTDTLPDNLRYLSDSRGFGMNFTPEFNPNASQVVQTLSWDFGDVTNAANGNGADDFFTIDVTVIVEDVTPDNINGVVLTNNASVTFTDGTGSTQTRDFDSDAGTAGIQGLDLTIVEPDVTITKTANPTTVSHGDEVTFTILLDHTVSSTADAFDLVVVDTLPVGLTYVAGSASITPIIVGQVLTFNIASLTLLSDQTSITFRATVDLVVAAGATLTNNAGLTYTSMPGLIPDERTYTDSDDAAVTVDQTTVIDAQKTVILHNDADGSGDVTPLDTLRYTVTIVNNGADAHNVVFDDTIPAHSALVVGSVTTSQGSITSGNTIGDTDVQVDIGTITDGGSVTLSFDTTVDTGTPEGTVISNQGVVDSDETEPEPTDEDGDDSNGDQPTDVHVGGPPAVTNALYVQKRVVMVNDVNGNGDVNPGDTLRYSLIIDNRGDEVLTNVSIDDVIPAGLTFVPATDTISGGTNPSITVTAPNVVITIDALAPGLRETSIATFDVTVDNPLENSSGDGDPTTETFVNQADTASDQTPDGLSDGNGDPGDGSQPTRITGVDNGTPGAPALDVEKRWSLRTDVDGDGLVDPSDTISYTITLENYGSAEAINVRLTDTLDALLTIVPGSLQTSQGVVVTETPINVNIGDMPVGAFVTISLQAVVDGTTPDGTIIPNQATASGDNFPDEPSDDNGDDSDGKNPTLTPVVTGSGSAGTPGGLTKTLFASSEAGSLVNQTFIGEVLTYRVSFQVPVGNLREVTLVDTLPAGLAYITGTGQLSHSFDLGLLSSENPGDINATGTDTFIPVADGTELIQTGQDLALFLGDITNSDNDGNVETYTLEIQVLVENITGNQAGTDLSNSATVSYFNNLGQPQSLTPVNHTTTVTEANMAVAKGSDPTMVTTVGGNVTFTVTVTNPDGGMTGTAYDVQILDVLSADWASLTVNSLTPSGGVIGVTDNTAGTTMDINVATFPADGQLIIVYTATTINLPPALSTLMTNTAVVTWTSLPGDHGTGNATPGNPGDADGERTGPVNGDPNDYTVQDSTDVVVGDTNLVKTINLLQIRYAIGDEVFYTVQVSLPPTATLVNSDFEDILDLGLTYVAGSLAINMDGVTSSTAPIEFIRTDDSPTAGQETLALDLGTLDNSNPDIRTLVFTYRALVDNILANQNGLDLNNNVTFSYDDPGGSARVIQTDTQLMTVGEPHLTLAKGITNTYVNLDAGDPVDFEIIVGNDGNLTGYDVVVSDTLPGGLENVTALSVSVSSGGAEIPTFTNNGTNWFTSAFDIPVGGSVTIVFTAELAVTVIPGQSIQNMAEATFSSRDGADPNERDGSTPGSHQDDNTDLNNYNHTGLSEIIVVGDPVAINKEFHPDTTHTTYTIGDTVGYRLTIAIHEGTINNLLVFDSLPAGLRYETLVVGTGNLGITHSYTPPPTVSGQDITVDLGQVVNPSNGANDDDYLTIDITATLENVPANQDGVFLGNHASLSYDGPSGTVTREYDADLGTPGIQPLELEVVEPDLALAKSVTPVDVWPGTNLTYTLVINHTVASRADAYGIVITDTLPVGVTFVPGSASLAPTVNGQVLTFDIAALTLVDHQLTITYEGLVDVNVALGVPLQNTAVATYTTQPGVHPDERTGDDGVGGLDDLITNVVNAVVIPTRPVVTVEKTDILFQDNNGDGLPSPGEILEYTVVIENSGNASSNNVIFTDTPDTHTSIVPGSITTTQGTITGGQAGIPPVTVDIGELVELTTVTITFQVQIDEPLDTAITFVSNQGIVSSDELDDIPSDDPDDPTGDDDPTDTPVFQADLSVVKSDDIDPIVLGNGDITYTLLVENHGPSDATQVLVTDTLPASFTYVSSTTTVGTATYNAGTHGVVIDVGDLANGGSVTVTITVTPTLEGTVNNQVEVESLEYDPDTDNNVDDEDTTVDPGVDLWLTKGVNNPNPDYQEVVTFTIILTNDGPSTATGITVADAWPADLVYVSHTTTAGTYDSGTGLWTLASLAAGNSETLQIDGRINGLGIQVNTAEVMAHNETDLDSTPGNGDPGEDDIASVSLEVNDALDLMLLKIVIASLPYPGATIVYSLDVQNLGPAPSFGTFVTDHLPPEVTYVSSLATQGFYDGITGIWDIGYMEPGDVHQLTIEVTINEDVPVGTVIANTANITSDLIDIDITNNEDDALIGTVAGVPTLSEWMLILFITAMGIVAMIIRRRS